MFSFNVWTGMRHYKYRFRYFNNYALDAITDQISKFKRRPLSSDANSKTKNLFKDLNNRMAANRNYLTRI